MAGVDARGLQCFEVKEKKSESKQRRERNEQKKKEKKARFPLARSAVSFCFHSFPLLSCALSCAPQSQGTASSSQRLSPSTAPRSFRHGLSLASGEKKLEETFSAVEDRRKRRANNPSNATFQKTWRSAPEQTASSACSPPRPRRRLSSARRAKVRKRRREGESAERRREREMGTSRLQNTSPMPISTSSSTKIKTLLPLPLHSQGRPPPRRQGRGRSRRQGLPHDARGQRGGGRLLGGGGGAGACPLPGRRRRRGRRGGEEDRGRQAGLGRRRAVEPRPERQSPCCQVVEKVVEWREVELYSRFCFSLLFVFGFFRVEKKKKRTTFLICFNSQGQSVSRRHHLLLHQNRRRKKCVPFENVC